MCGSTKVEEQIVCETDTVEHYEKVLEFSFEAPVFCCNSEGCAYAWGAETYHTIRDSSMRHIRSVADTDKYNNATFDLDGMIW